jgi:hypothetical protein
MNQTSIDPTPVNSSSIATVSYAATHELLDIEFRSGAVYRYFNVPLDAYRALVEAESIGRHFAHRIRPRYRHLRLVAKK